MISVQNAIELIVKNTQIFPVESLPLELCHGKILGEDIVSERDAPPFNRVAMDGIAIALSSWKNGQRSFNIEGIQAAGQPQQFLQSQENCFEVMTGSILPNGCDAVIRYEDININNKIASIREDIQIKPMHNIHRHGEDHKKGDRLLRKGQKLNSPKIAILASNGHSKVKVYKCPSIAIISTGDELVDLDQTPLPHQIRKSNTYALKSELIGHGLTRINLYHIKDDREALFEDMKSILDSHDVMILSGGISMGKFDFVPQILRDLKVKEVFHKVAQRPGKPFWFGHKNLQKPVFALPGNPISCLTCLRRYVIPALQNCLGASKVTNSVAVLTKDHRFKKNLTYFCPVKTTQGEDGILYATPVKNNGSGDYASLGKTDGFIELRAEDDHFPKEHPYLYFSWGQS